MRYKEFKFRCSLNWRNEAATQTERNGGTISAGREGKLQTKSFVNLRMLFSPKTVPRVAPRTVETALRKL